MCVLLFNSFVRNFNMFEKLRDLIAKIQLLFPELLVKEAVRVLDKLEEVSRDIFVKMENIIFRTLDSKVIVPTDGGVHQRTKYVMGYVGFAYGAQHVFEHIVV